MTEARSSRTSGRPRAETSDELDRHILDTAKRLFVGQGYAATSMEQIAAAAQAGKQTIYRRYAGKEQLFEAVARSVSTALLETMAKADLRQAKPMEALRDACRAMLTYVCDPQVIAILRVLIAEAERFPKLAELARGISNQRHAQIFQPLLQAAQEIGAIDANASPEALGRALSGLITGWVLHQSLLAGRGLADNDERNAFFDIAWEIFVRGLTDRKLLPVRRRTPTKAQSASKPLNNPRA